MNHITNVYFGSEEITKEIFAKLDHIHQHLLKQDEHMATVKEMLCKIMENQEDANAGQLDTAIKRLAKITRQIKKIVE